MIGSSPILNDATVRAVVAYRDALREVQRLNKVDLSLIPPGRSGEHFAELARARSYFIVSQINLDVVLGEDA